MTIDDLLKDAEVLRLEPSAEHMKEAIERRLKFVEKTARVTPGSLLQITDGAYNVIAQITQSSVGLALEVMKMLLDSRDPKEDKIPYIITEEHVNRLGLTYERLCKYWDSPFRGATIINCDDR